MKPHRNDRERPSKTRRSAALALALACTAACSDDSSREHDESLGGGRTYSSNPMLQVRHHTPGPPAYLPNAAAACPVPPVTALNIPATDSWSGLITLRDPTGLYLAPIHAIMTIDGDIMYIGYSRTTPDFDPNKLDVTPTFIVKPGLQSDADVTLTGVIYGVDYDSIEDSFFCAGHSILEDGRLIAVGGTRVAKHAIGPTGTPRAFGMTYGATFGPQGWVRIPRDFIGGEAWYPSLIRLSDGRHMMFSGYYEADAPAIPAAILTYNRTLQIFDANASDPWTVISPSSSTPAGTYPSNYTWLFELPDPIDVGGKSRQVLIMGGSGMTFLVNHTDPAPDPATRFVARTQRPNLGNVMSPAEDGTVLFAPFFHEAEKRFYRPGSIFVIGGSSEPTEQDIAEVYDPYIDKWCRLTKPLGIKRRNAVGVQLPDGNILVVNGQALPVADPAKPQNTPQIIDPRTGLVANGKPENLSTTRGYHNNAVLLPDGRVLLAGGRATLPTNPPDSTDERSDAHFYSPYYLGIVPPSDRPAILGIPKDPVLHYGQTDYVVDYKNGEITGAVLVGLPSMTHATDFNSRYVELEITGGTDRRGKVTIAGPKHGRIAPPGPYMLFLQRKIGGVDVPSVAQIIRVGGPNPTCGGSSPVNGCGGCETLRNLPGASCQNRCGVGTFKCDSPNRTSCNACL